MEIGRTRIAAVLGLTAAEEGAADAAGDEMEAAGLRVIDQVLAGYGHESLYGPIAAGVDRLCACPPRDRALKFPWLQRRFGGDGYLRSTLELRHAVRRHHPAMAAGPSIAVLGDCGLGYFRAITRGVIARVAPEVRILFGDAADMRSCMVAGLAGVIAHCSHEGSSIDLMALCQARGIPVVNTSYVRPLPLPRLGVDDHAVGRLAAEHLIDRGLRRLAVMGMRHCYSVDREAGFATAAGDLGLPCHRWTDPADGSRREETQRRWLEALPRPIGLFVPSDVHARTVLHFIQTIPLRIPEDIAVVGCDDDELICTMCRPPLSSVRLDGIRMGNAAYAILEGLMAGGKAPAEPLLLPPLGVTTRASTDLAAAVDADLLAALHFIRSRCHCRIQVQDIAAAAHVSRSTLERRFRSTLGRSPLEELMRQRLDLAMRLLLDGDATVGAVARQCGFSDANHLAGHFQQRFASTPAAFQTAHRAAAKPSSR